MKLGRIVPIDGHCIPITPDFAPFLGLREKSQVHLIVNLKGASPPYLPEISFSTIPFHVWPVAYKMDINLRHVPGRQLHCAEILEKHGANIMISESVCSTTTDWGFLSLVFEFVEKPTQLHQPLKRRVERLDHRAQALFGAFKENGVPRSGRGATPRGEVNPLSPPSRLPELGRLYALAQESHLEHHEVRLAGSSLPLPPDLLDHVRRVVGSLPNRALVSVDTEERVGNVLILPRTDTMIHLDLDIRWRGQGHPPVGAYRRVLESLRDHDVNIFRSFNYILQKDEEGEVCRLHFIGYSPRLETDRTFRRHLQSELQGLTIRKRSLGVTQPMIHRGSTSAPHCFLARPVSERKSSRFRRLEALARGLGFSVLTGELTGGRLVRDFIRSEIARSACLISLWTQERKRQLRTPRRERRYVPSEWLVFEQEVAHALGVSVFQLLEEGVTLDPLYYGNEPLTFEPGDSKSFNVALKALEANLVRWMQSNEYLDAVVRASERQARSAWRSRPARSPGRGLVED